VNREAREEAEKVSSFLPFVFRDYVAPSFFVMKTETLWLVDEELNHMNGKSHIWILIALAFSHSFRGCHRLALHYSTWPGPTQLSEDLVRYMAAITGFKELIIIVGGKSANCSRNPVFIKPRMYPSHLMEEDTVATRVGIYSTYGLRWRCRLSSNCKASKTNDKQREHVSLTVTTSLARTPVLITITDDLDPDEHEYYDGLFDLSEWSVPTIKFAEAKTEVEIRRLREESVRL
jgi:hypothetical protein